MRSIALLLFALALASVPETLALSATGSFLMRPVDVDGSTFEVNVINLKADADLYINLPSCESGQVVANDECGSRESSTHVCQRACSHSPSDAEPPICCPESHQRFCSDNAGSPCRDNTDKTAPSSGATVPAKRKLADLSRHQYATSDSTFSNYVSIACTGFTPEGGQDDHGPSDMLLPATAAPLDAFFENMEISEGIHNVEDTLEGMSNINPAEWTNIGVDPALLALMQLPFADVDPRGLSFLNFASMYNPLSGQTTRTGPEEKLWKEGKCTIT